MAHLVPARPDGTNPTAVRMLHRVDVVRDALRRRRVAWPVTGGAYRVGDPHGCVAVCTLTSDDLYEPLSRRPGVAIAGRVYVPNLGIEKIVLNVTSNPGIRYLVVCGKESPVFHPGEALLLLHSAGVDPDRRIVGATGHLPVLSNVSAERIAAFRAQVQVVDLTGERDDAAISARIAALVELAPPSYQGGPGAEAPAAGGPVLIRPGGRREPQGWDPAGYFVVSVDQRRVVARHYLTDNTLAHEMRGHSAEAMLLGLLREGLVTQLSHAGYLGGELTKAETALRLGLPYEQDRPLRSVR